MVWCLGSCRCPSVTVTSEIFEFQRTDLVLRNSGSRSRWSRWSLWSHVTQRSSPQDDPHFKTAQIETWKAWKEWKVVQKGVNGMRPQEGNILITSMQKPVLCLTNQQTCTFPDSYTAQIPCHGTELGIAQSAQNAHITRCAASLTKVFVTTSFNVAVWVWKWIAKLKRVKNATWRNTYSICFSTNRTKPFSIVLRQFVLNVSAHYQLCETQTFMGRIHLERPGRRNDNNTAYSFKTQYIQCVFICFPIFMCSAPSNANSEASFAPNHLNSDLLCFGLVYCTCFGSVTFYFLWNINIYIYIYIYIYLSINLSIYLSIYLPTYLSIYVSICHLYMCMYVCMYVCMHACMYVCIYLHSFLTKVALAHSLSVAAVSDKEISGPVVQNWSIVPKMAHASQPTQTALATWTCWS